MDDSILAVDGVRVPAMPRGSHSSSSRVLAVNRQLDEAARDGVMVLTLKRRGDERKIRVVPEQGCGTRFQTAANDTVGAAADGDAVEVDTGAMRFADNDSEIAAIVAHELAHNILRHQERLSKAGVRNARGARNARLTRQTEEEADRLSVYLMERAGYPPDAIISFWRRMVAEEGDPSMRFPTHGSPEERIEIVTAEIAHMVEMKRKGRASRPEFMAGNGLPDLR
jgi:predicted Zn-dependent protease